jgi:predicted transcriptional regulator
MTRLTIRLPEVLKTQLDEISQEENMAVSDIVRESLRRYVAIEKLRSAGRSIRPFAEAQGLLTDDDVFKALV